MEAVVTSPQREALTNPEALVIHLGPLKSHLSDDEFFEFCALNSDLRIEMTKEGEMIIMLPCGSEGGHRNFNLTVEFGVWAKTDGTGVGFDSSSGFTLPNGAKRAPDLSWIERERWEAIPRKQRKKFAPICPDFVVELRSETDTLLAVKQKMEDYMESGAQLGWLIDPIQKKVHIYRPNVEVEILDNPRSVSGEPLLRGFVLDLSRIFD